MNTFCPSTDDASEYLVTHVKSYVRTVGSMRRHCYRHSWKERSYPSANSKAEPQRQSLYLGIKALSFMLLLFYHARHLLQTLKLP